MLKFGHWLCLSKVEELKDEIKKEAHYTSYTSHLGSTKMHQDLQHSLLWDGMTKDIVDFVQKCLVCQQVKAKHQKPSGLLNWIILL